MFSLFKKAYYQNDADAKNALIAETKKEDAYEACFYLGHLYLQEGISVKDPTETKDPDIETIRKLQQEPFARAKHFFERAMLAGPVAYMFFLIRIYQDDHIISSLQMTEFLLENQELKDLATGKVWFREMPSLEQHQRVIAYIKKSIARASSKEETIPLCIKTANVKVLYHLIQDENVDIPIKQDAMKALRKIANSESDDENTILAGVYWAISWQQAVDKGLRKYKGNGVSLAVREKYCDSTAFRALYFLELSINYYPNLRDLTLIGLKKIAGLPVSRSPITFGSEMIRSRALDILMTDLNKRLVAIVKPTKENMLPLLTEFQQLKIDRLYMGDCTAVSPAVKWICKEYPKIPGYNVEIVRNIRKELESLNQFDYETKSSLVSFEGPIEALKRDFSALTTLNIRTIHPILERFISLLDRDALESPLEILLNVKPHILLWLKTEYPKMPGCDIRVVTYARQALEHLSSSSPSLPAFSAAVPASLKKPIARILDPVTLPILIDIPECRY